MIEWAIDKLIERAQRTPYFHLPGYMERYHLFQTRWLSARIHIILRSDDDRALHCHPWNYCSIILRGGYVEITPTGDQHFPLRGVGFGPGSILFRRARSLHRLVLPTGQAAVTLFIHGRKRREWGFETPEGWVRWQDYENAIENGQVSHSWRAA